MRSVPLAERMRPRTLDEYVGQAHLVGKGAVMRQMIETGNLSPFILWGPPGVGKTTLAQLVARSTGREFYTLSAVSAGVKEVREVLSEAAKLSASGIAKPPVLFIDEIHRFSKSQQDSLLGAVERGEVVLIGATTENPSFEVIAPLLSRCQVYTLRQLSPEELQTLLDRALREDAELQKVHFDIREREALFGYAAGDGRRLLNIVELLYNARSGDRVEVSNALVEHLLQSHAARYDKKGEQHYDMISAFIKSIRGSDPNGAIYWMARMLDGGEDPVFIARRMVISASEDVGLANPNALLLAMSGFDAVRAVGMPEARIILSEVAVYLASSAKSNASYQAINNALKLVHGEGPREVPLHLRNAETQLMREWGYGRGYQYAHDFLGNFAYQEYLPAGLEGHAFYTPQDNPREREMRARLARLWRRKYGY